MISPNEISRLPLINIILMAGFFCITRISGTSHKIGRNFSQDLPHLVTRYQASRFLASFYVLFCGHIPLPVGNMPLPKNCSKNPSEVSASPQTPCSWAFRLKDWLLKFFSRVFILSAGIYVFSAMAVYFPASSEFSPCTCVDVYKRQVLYYSMRDLSGIFFPVFKNVTEQLIEI